MNTLVDTDSNASLQARIQNLMARYAHAIDDDRLEQWSGFFTANGIYKITSRENFDRNLPLAMVYCTGTGMLDDRITALRTANIYEPHVYCHMVGAVELTSGSEGEYYTRANFTILRTMSEGDTSIFACGRYLDVIVETDSGLKFKQRTIVLDSRRIDTLLVIPV
ncbi:MAG: aromatic-ring-hydroxylating dioxygenase subunit beta [Beijerinckiaceae bacterium]|jgi:anthranilate 1,2-dioxygenase small subunit|nr:aromatic-ring-hydroxylating dioxygenase subunit beta [Beijerinckiaceae bacterium]